MTVSQPGYIISDIDCHNCSHCYLKDGGYFCNSLFTKDNIDNVARYELSCICEWFYNVTLTTPQFLKWILS